MRGTVTGVQQISGVVENDDKHVAGSALRDIEVKPMPHITIGTVETLPAGSEAAATMTGTELDPVLNLSIPQGAQGIQGPQGPRGERGYQGEKGPKGDQGIQGPRGPEGQRGPQGPQGEKGDRGPQGDTGSQGPQGVRGERGPAGPQGEPGPQGPAGQDGQDGQDGNDYVLTSADKAEIADLVLAEIPVVLVEQDEVSGGLNIYDM